LARVGELESAAEKTPGRFVANFAQCMSSFTRGEIRPARETAETFLKEAEAEGRTIEAGVARRTLGLVLLFQGNFGAARTILARVLNDYNLAQDADGPDAEVGAAAFLALTEWHLGEFERARQLIDHATRRANEKAHILTVANALLLQAILESRRHDAMATRNAAEALLALTEERGIRTFMDMGQVYVDWARGRLLDPRSGASELRRALAKLNAQGHKLGMPSFYGLLAELEVTQGPDSALTLVEEGLALAEETGEHFTDAYLHRLRGEILLKRDPTDPAPAEDAYRNAIAVAKKQAARGYELLASLALAKLYQSTGRPAEAHAILAPALEGFSPTPEMPEIAEARALLVAIEAAAHARHE
jgi:tetratricopeptide (TPR) repeat protein